MNLELIQYISEETMSWMEIGFHQIVDPWMIPYKQKAAGITWGGGSEGKNKSKTGEEELSTSDSSFFRYTPT